MISSSSTAVLKKLDKFSLPAIPDNEIIVKAEGPQGTYRWAFGDVVIDNKVANKVYERIKKLQIQAKEPRRLEDNARRYLVAKGLDVTDEAIAHRISEMKLQRPIDNSLIKQVSGSTSPVVHAPMSKSAKKAKKKGGNTKPTPAQPVSNTPAPQKEKVSTKETKDKQTTVQTLRVKTPPTPPVQQKKKKSGPAVISEIEKTKDLGTIFGYNQLRFLEKLCWKRPTTVLIGDVEFDGVKQVRFNIENSQLKVTLHTTDATAKR